jgi:hypothetical protein
MPPCRTASGTFGESLVVPHPLVCPRSPPIATFTDGRIAGDAYYLCDRNERSQAALTEVPIDLQDRLRRTLGAGAGTHPAHRRSALSRQPVLHRPRRRSGARRREALATSRKLGLRPGNGLSFCDFPFQQGNPVTIFAAHISCNRDVHEIVEDRAGRLERVVWVVQPRRA